MTFRIVRSSPVNLERHIPQLRAEEKNAHGLALTVDRLEPAAPSTLLQQVDPQPFAPMAPSAELPASG
jgi:hypothetical protein